MPTSRRESIGFHAFCRASAGDPRASGDVIDVIAAIIAMLAAIIAMIVTIIAMLAR
jgi:hypothetical protein